MLHVDSAIGIYEWGGQRVANTLYHHHIIQRKIDVITYNDPDIETFIQSYANWIISNQGDKNG